jgi:ribonuclease HI
MNDIIQRMAIAVDAACSGNPGKMEYRGVDVGTGKEIFHQGPFEDGTNNIGEFLALVHGLGYLQRKGDNTTPVYTDSKTARAWVRDKKIKSTLKPTARNENLFDLVRRALAWLQTHNYGNPILTWDTPNWGEIPADFGRKK